MTIFHPPFLTNAECQRSLHIDPLVRNVDNWDMKNPLARHLVFAGSVRSGLLTLRDIDRDLDRSTVTIKEKKTGLNWPRPQLSVHGPVLTSPGLYWFKTGLDRFFC